MYLGQEWTPEYCRITGRWITMYPLELRVMCAITLLNGAVVALGLVVS